MKNEMIANYQETPTELKVTFKKASLRYLDEFIKLKCAPDLLLNKLFPNAKEITESLAAFNAYRRNLINVYPTDGENINCIVVGDGVTPRTGAIFAMRTKFHVISIDPLMRISSDSCHHDKILGLSMIKNPAEFVDYSSYIHKHIVKGLLIIVVHSHAPLDKLIKQIEKTTKIDKFHIISIPCCYEDNIEQLDTITKITSYNDFGIHSEKRTINIYKYSKKD